MFERWPTRGQIGHDDALPGQNVSSLWPEYAVRWGVRWGKQDISLMPAGAFPTLLSCAPREPLRPCGGDFLPFDVFPDLPRCITSVGKRFCSAQLLTACLVGRPKPSREPICVEHYSHVLATSRPQGCLSEPRPETCGQPAGREDASRAGSSSGFSVSLCCVSALPVGVEYCRAAAAVDHNDVRGCGSPKSAFAGCCGIVPLQGFLRVVGIPKIVT
jgi:hypothetical protein